MAVRFRGSRVQRLTQPFREWVRRSALALLLLTAGFLLLLGRTHSEATAQLRAAIADLFAPVLAGVSQPVTAVRNGIDEVRQWMLLRSENARLKEENARLLQWQTAARRLDQENAVLRAQLSARSEPRPVLLTARVIADSAGPFVRTLLLNAGRRDGVEKGHAAIAGEGLVGRVIEVGERSSRLLLVTDLNARVPVLLETSRIRGLMAGDNTDRPRLAFLSQGRMQPGERVVTSGHDGVIPPGLPIGEVVAGEPGQPRVKLLVDGSNLEFVQLVRFDLPRLEAAKPETPEVPASASRRGRAGRARAE